tara:strand:- start:1753 stop:2292 length:540 start_codon:yes stop_codon:yes gene_type:complete
LNQTYKIDFKSIKKHLISPLIKILVIDLVVVTILAFSYKVDYETIAVLIVGLIGCSGVFFIIPLIFLYYNYMRCNNNCELHFVYNGTEPLQLKYLSPDKTYTFHEDQISKIKSNLSYTEYENRMSWFFWDYLYSYNELILVNGSNIIISSLLCDRLFIHLKENKVEKIKRILPKIRNCR